LIFSLNYVKIKIVIKERVIIMDSKNLNVSKELLDNLSVEELAQLNWDVNELSENWEDIIKNCERLLNS
jgi:hypothetical protein